MSRRFPPRDEPPHRRPRRDLPRPEGPFERLLRQKPERDPAPIIIGGTVAFLAVVIVMVFVFSSVFGGDDDSTASGNGGDGGRCAEVATDLEGCLASMPGLPPGLVAASQFVEFETEKDTPAVIGLPLRSETEDPTGLGFYTYSGNRWQRLVDATLEENGTVAQGNFSSIPKNVAVLRVVAQTYQVAASLPHGGSLHGDAGNPQVISPRDYSPASDGSVQGSATNVTRAEGTLLLPTIVGSSQDTAAVVNDIVADESLRATHIQNIANLVQNNGLDGIDLEYSSVNADSASQFTSFVEALADALHRNDKRLSLTLPPPGNQRSAYEWKKLGEAVDLIKILPIADPVSYWETMPGSLSRVTQDVDPKKVLLVVSPFAIDGQGDISRAMGYLQAMALAGETAVREPTDPAQIVRGANVKLVAKNLDEGEGGSPLRWDSQALTVSFAVGGTERRRIFIENSYSAGFKLELVQAYGLGGVAVSDGSAQSDVANIWPAVHELVNTSTVTLRRPNESMLAPVWQAPDGGDLGAGAGTSATWTAPSAGDYNIVLVVSDGERRFGQRTLVQVRQSDEPSPSPLETFAPSETPTPSATPEGSETETPAAGVIAVEVGVLADGDDEGGAFSNNETVTPGSQVVYLVTVDNDSNTPVTITSLLDDTYPGVTCETPGGSDIVGLVLGADDGDEVGNINGGADELQCTFTADAPGESGVTVTNTVSGGVQDDEGNTDEDSDTASIVTS